jgi:hypothetical protein
MPRQDFPERIRSKPNRGATEYFFLRLQRPGKPRGAEHPKKYLPRPESKLEELKRLDLLVQHSGVTESLSTGIGSCLIFGLGLCLAMEVIGHMVWLGVILGLAGIAGMLAVFPVYRRFFNKAKAQHSHRILELAAELSDQV